MENLSIRSLQEANLQALEQIRNEISRLFKAANASKEDITCVTLRNLFAYLSLRSQTVSLLISYECAWDAEIILRSFYETTAKILFIAFCPEQDKEELVLEFWQEFDIINNRRTAQKAIFARQMFEEDTLPSKIFGAFEDEKIFNQIATKSKKDRRRLEQKWSFVEIVEKINRWEKDGAPAKGIKSLLHIYGMASHLAHADKSALELMHDRARRPPDELRVLEIAHMARIMSDQGWLSWYCCQALRQHFGISDNNYQGSCVSVKYFAELYKPFEQLFYEYQKDFYNI